MVTATPPSARHHRLAVASRVVAAVAGGYAGSALFGIALATVLRTASAIDPADAAMTATLLALLAIPVAAMAVFWARTATRAWGGILTACALFASVALAGGWRP